MKTLEHRVTCLSCKTVNPLATPVEDEDAVPVDGAVSICWSCGAVAIFDERSEGGLRAPTYPECIEFTHDDEFQRLLKARLAVRGA